MTTVIDLSHDVAGRYCARMLALIGAEVVRPVPAGEPDPLAGWAELGYPIDLLDAGKRVEAIDMVEPAARERLRELISSAAAVIDDGGPNGPEHLGLNGDDLHAWAGDAVLVRVSDFGLDGPRAHWQGSDLVSLAAGGMLFLTGTHDRPPVQLAPFQASLTTGLLAALAAGAALYGGGAVEIDVSEQEAVSAMIAPALTEYAYTGVIPAREGTVAGMTRIEQAADDWVYAGPSAPGIADYTAMASLLDIPELAEERFSTQERRMENWEEHQRLIVPRLQQKTAREWVDAGAERRLTFGLVQTTAGLLECETLAERDFFQPFDSTLGRARVPAAPYLVDGARSTPEGSAG